MSEYTLLGVFTLFVSALSSLLITPLVIAIAPRIGAVDIPEARKVHGRPIARIGGIAVFGGFMSGLLFAAWATGSISVVRQVSVYWSVLAACAAGMFLLGLVDDIRHVSFKVKFLFQVAASVFIWIGGFRIVEVTHPFQEGALVFPVWVSILVTVLWVVGITNAMNLIDGLDGLAAGTALIMTLTVACIAFIQNQAGVLATSVALVGSLIGFLFFNFNPAKVFLGDSGSMFLGFVLAVISMKGSQKGPAAVAVLVPLLVLALPILDTSLAVTRRLQKVRRQGAAEGRGFSYLFRNLDQLFLPDRGHLHHQLLDLGYGHRSAVLILYCAVILLAVAALALVIVKSKLVAVVIVVLLTIGLTLFLLLNGTARLQKRELESDKSRLDDKNVP